MSADLQENAEGPKTKRLKTEKSVMTAVTLRDSSPQLLERIDLMVCDMAGTTVEEGGIVYKTLQQSMEKHGLKVSDKDIHPWHGAKKEAVIEHFAKQAGMSDSERQAKVKEISAAFEASIDDAYFSETAKISLIHASLPSWFQQLKEKGIKIGLDTGYPKHIQNGLVKKLGLGTHADSWISSYEVKEGRPYPYMIHQLMERVGVADVRRVCKIGDSCRDVEMGKNAGCGLVVGVLSGADSAEDLFAAGADIVCEVITDLPVPSARLPNLKGA